MFKTLIGILCACLLMSGCGKKKSSSPQPPPSVSTNSDFSTEIPIPPGKSGSDESTDPDQVKVEPLTQEQISKLLDQGQSTSPVPVTASNTDKSGDSQQILEVETTEQQLIDSETQAIKTDSETQATSEKTEALTDTQTGVSLATETPSKEASSSTTTSVVDTKQGLAQDIQSSIAVQEQISQQLPLLSSQEVRLTTEEVQTRLNQLAQGTRKEESVLTGSKDVQSQLPFSGSQNDELLSFLKNKMSGLAQYKASLEWTKKIGSFEMIENSSAPIAKIYWKGVSGYELDTVSLVVSDSSSIQVREGISSKGYSVRQVCLDPSNACAVSVIKLQDTIRNLTAFVIVRKTSAHVHLNGNAAQCSNNGPYQKFLGALQNNPLIQQRPELRDQLTHLSKVSFTSFEVVQGSSAYDIQLEIKTSNDCTESLSLRGALLTGLKSSVVSMAIPLSKQVKWNADGQVIQTPGILDALNCAILQKNDGLGNLQFEMQFGSTSQGVRAEKFDLFILRNAVEMNIQSIQQF